MSTTERQAPRRSEMVHERLRERILGGELAPGAAVPSERVLAEELGVNRHAVREALKRLEQAGLVQIAQGGPTRVLDWRATGGLEVLLDLVDHPGELPPGELLRAALELRACIGADAARRCAARASAGERAEVARLAEAVIAAAGAGARAGAAAGDGAIAAYDALWNAIVEGAGNLAYRLALNSLLGALESFPALAAALVPREGETLRALADAIAAGDPDAAGRAAAALLEPDAED